MHYNIFITYQHNYWNEKKINIAIKILFFSHFIGLQGFAPMPKNQIIRQDLMNLDIFKPMQCIRQETSRQGKATQDKTDCGRISASDSFSERTLLQRLHRFYISTEKRRRVSQGGCGNYDEARTRPQHFLQGLRGGGVRGGCQRLLRCRRQGGHQL